MVSIDPAILGGALVAAFMDMLASACAEGTANSPITQCDGYDIIVTGIDGRHRFDDFSTHPFASGRPDIVVNSKGLKSNASGRYQFMLHDWADYQALLKLPDFGPVSQDMWCYQLIKEREALPMLLAGNLDGAIAACSNIWASLTGAGYGQHEATLDQLHAAYQTALDSYGGVVPEYP